MKLNEIWNDKSKHGPYLIAEIGVNHNGSLELAMNMVRAAADSGADAVKFQTFTAEDLVTKITPKVRYQESTTSPDESHYEMIEALEMPLSFYDPLISLCGDLNLEFCSTPYDPKSVLFLESLEVPYYKVASADIVDLVLLKSIARTNKPVILSTGMSTLVEIEEAVRVLTSFGNERLVLLHCVSNYPCSNESLNLRSINLLQNIFGYQVGFSDHSVGSLAATLSVALGASVIEKHFTLDKNLPGPDHLASSTPDEFLELSQAIKNAEKALGLASKFCQKEEMQMSEVSRKSVVASRDLAAGTILSVDDLVMKRPGTGLKANQIEKLLGKQLREDLVKDEQIDWSHLS